MLVVIVVVLTVALERPERVCLTRGSGRALDSRTSLHPCLEVQQQRRRRRQRQHPRRRRRMPNTLI